jgi:regulator of protease activity HflC (stomatin/prohibitin superfamily)
MRIITGAKVEGNDHILNAQMALETIFSVRWSVQGKGFFEFYINIPGNSWDEKLAQIRKQMRDTGEGKLGELYSERTPDSIIAQLGGPEGLNTALEMTLEDAVCKWGITIDEARIQSPDLSHDVSIALASIPAANARKVATIAAAQGEKEKLKLEGEGRGEARKAELAAEGEGLKAAAAAMGLTPAEYFAGQIARDTIGKGTVIFGDGGLAQAMLAGKTMLDAVTNQKEKDKP